MEQQKQIANQGWPHPPVVEPVVQHNPPVPRLMSEQGERMAEKSAPGSAVKEQFFYHWPGVNPPERG